MLNRIKQILQNKGLQSSTFAEMIGVSRGTVSHILNGRNEPSKDTIDKILKTFPDISPAWFVNCQGQMYRHEQIIIKQDSPKTPKQPDLFNQNQPVESTEKPEVMQYPLKTEVEEAEIISKPIDIQKINVTNLPSRKIDKIIIFFNDKTFMTFISED